MGALDKCPVKASRGRSAGPAAVPPQIDIRKPSAARVYDAILGGKDNFPWDRAVAAAVIAAFPILNGIVHHLNEDEDPHGVVVKLTSALAPGSYLQLTHFSTAAPAAAALERVLMRSLGSGRMRSAGEITAFFDGLELVNPGVVFLH